MDIDSNKKMGLNIDYLCNGIYFDKINKGKLSEEVNLSNNYKKKMMNSSNGLSNIINDIRYKNLFDKNQK
jgi:hypothetical protein